MTEQNTEKIQTQNIRKVYPSDTGRLAEIIVFNRRKNFYPIFKDTEYYFAEYNVIDVTNEFQKDEEFMQNTYVYDDGVVKGFMCVVGEEIIKLYIEYFFQGEGIGSKLLNYAIDELHANTLWTLEKNTKAITFYKKHGFRESGEKKFEEDTTEYLIRLVR